MTLIFMFFLKSIDKFPFFFKSYFPPDFDYDSEMINENILSFETSWTQIYIYFF